MAKFEIQGRIDDRPSSWMLAIYQFKQMLILPVSFFFHSSIGIRGVCGSVDGL